MGYYMRGDYYRGDYYRGDPFLGGLFGSVASKVAPVVGKAASWIGRKVAGGGAASGAGKLPAAVLPVITKQLPKIGRKVAPIAGTLATGVAAGGIAETIFGDDDEVMRPRRRKMNVANVKALRRALRRAEGFEKIARRTVNALHRGPAKFKKQRKAS